MKSHSRILKKYQKAISHWNLKNEQEIHQEWRNVSEVFLWHSMLTFLWIFFSLSSSELKVCRSRNWNSSLNFPIFSFNSMLGVHTAEGKCAIASGFTKAESEIQKLNYFTNVRMLEWISFCARWCSGFCRCSHSRVDLVLLLLCARRRTSTCRKN